MVLGVVLVLLAEPGRHRLDHRHVTNHRIDVLFHDALGIVVRRAPHADTAFLVLELVGDVRHQHLGVADPRRLRQVQFMHQVIAHGVE
ncbi:hypothetical protein D9M71_765710 [compost metagenome]